jgi:hypothetical protein
VAHCRHLHRSSGHPGVVGDKSPLRSKPLDERYRIYNTRMGRQASKTIIPQGWTIDIRSTTFAIITLAIVAALFAFLHHVGPPQHVSMPAQGTIQDARIVPDHALETKSGGHVTWKAEYKVSYSVASREYAVWADSGIRAESEADVARALRQSRPSCRVQYNPERPDVSVAVCQ